MLHRASGHHRDEIVAALHECRVPATEEAARDRLARAHRVGHFTQHLLRQPAFCLALGAGLRARLLRAVRRRAMVLRQRALPRTLGELATAATTAARYLLKELTHGSALEGL